MPTLTETLATERYADARKRGDVAGILTLLNEPRNPARHPIEPDVLRAGLMNSGVWSLLRAVQRDPAAPVALAAAADTVIDAVQPGGLKLINLDAEAATALFDGFEAAGILSAEIRAWLLTLGDTLISDAELALGRRAAEQDVTEVLNV